MEVSLDDGFSTPVDNYILVWLTLGLGRFCVDPRSVKYTRRWLVAKFTLFSSTAVRSDRISHTNNVDCERHWARDSCAVVEWHQWRSGE